MGGGEGEGENRSQRISWLHPHPDPPPSRGRENVKACGRLALIRLFFKYLPEACKIISPWSKGRDRLRHRRQAFLYLRMLKKGTVGCQNHPVRFPGADFFISLRRNKSGL